jgi:hypothetical protein
MNAFPRISLGFCALLALLASSSESRADGTNRAKGIAGGALVGAEVVILTEAVIGVKPMWLYAVGAAVGAGGGGVAGYYLGGVSSPKPPSFVLAGGIALFIPTLIGLATATQFQPDDSYQQQRAPEEDTPEARRSAPRAPLAQASVAHPAMRDALPQTSARLELPQLEVTQTFTAEEVQAHRVRQVPSVHLSLLRGVF